MDHQEVDFIEEQIDWKWCLLAISGNATIVKLRRNDFVKYVKMNVASLVGSEYDLVRVTSISYTPYVLVNVSLNWNEATEPRIIKALGGLALHNDTLLDLSGEHFNLTEFSPATALLSPKALSPLEERDAAAAAADPRQVQALLIKGHYCTLLASKVHFFIFQMEAMIYLVIGVCAAFLVTATLIFTVCHCLNKHPAAAAANHAKLMTSEAGQDEFDRRSSSRHTFNRHSYLQQSPMTEETISLDDFDGGGGHLQQQRRSIPKLIYTQEFSDGLMVIPNEEEAVEAADDSLAPLASFEDDGYVPHQFVLRRSNGGHHHTHRRHLPLHSGPEVISQSKMSCRHT